MQITRSNTVTSSEPLLRPRMLELDTLRGIAVSLVVCFHSFGFLYGINGLSGIPRVLVALTLPGWARGESFLCAFRISDYRDIAGHEVTSNYYRRFYVRGALRILPLYYAVLLLLLVLARSGLVERHVSWSFLALSSVYLANVTTLFGVPMQYGVLWSLAVEEHFYLLWPAVVHHLSRLNVIVCAGVIAALCLLLRVLYCVLGHPVPGYTWLAADGLAMGAVLAAVARCSTEGRRNVRRFTGLAFASGLALFAIGAPFGIVLARHFLGLTLRETALNLFFAGVVGLTLLVGTSKWRGIVNRPVFQFLGEISYGVYLIHMLVFEVVVHFIHRALPGLAPTASHFRVMMLQFCIASCMTIGLAVLSRRYFEQPFLNLKDRQKVAVPPLLAEAHKEDAECMMSAMWPHSQKASLSQRRVSV